MSRSLIRLRSPTIAWPVEAPRRCGRIAGCGTCQLNPSPKAPRPAIPRRQRSGDVPRLVEPTLVAQANHLIDEDLLLLVVEARIKRLSRVSHTALVPAKRSQLLSCASLRRSRRWSTFQFPSSHAQSRRRSAALAAPAAPDRISPDPPSAANTSRRLKPFNVRIASDLR